MTPAGPAISLALALATANGAVPVESPATRSPTGLLPAHTQRLALVVTRVVDQDGVPVPGASVRLIDCRGPSINANSLLPSLAPSPVPVDVDTDCNERVRETDAAGEASFPSVRVGSTTVDPRARRFNYVLRVEKAGYQAAGQVITPRPARNEVELVMYRGDSVAGLLIEEAQAAVAAGDYAAAQAAMVELVDMALESYAGGPPPAGLVSWMRYLAYIQMLGADGRGARATLDRLLELDPYDTFGIRALGVLAVRQQDWQLARDQFDLYLLLEPEDADAWLMMGSLLVELEELDEAFEHLDRALELDRSNPGVHRALGFAHVAAGNNAGAIASLERYLQLADNPPDANQIRATIASLRRP